MHKVPTCSMGMECYRVEHHLFLAKKLPHGWILPKMVAGVSQHVSLVFASWVTAHEQAWRWNGELTSSLPLLLPTVHV
jgi:hypothetical protein